jgi:excisionase family DNA binding protein
MGKRLGFGASRPFNLEEELADELARLNADDGSAELDRMLPSGVTAEEAFTLKQQHDRRAAAAAQPRPRPKRKAAPPKTTAENGMLTVAGAADRLNTSPDHVLDLIHSSRIKAVNVGRGTKRPRWRIAPEALKEFTGGRETSTSGMRTRTRRTKGPAEVEYF